MISSLALRRGHSAALAVAAISISLAACGGGGGGATSNDAVNGSNTPSPTTPVASGITGTVTAPSAPLPPPPPPPPASTLSSTGQWSPIIGWPVIALHAALLPDGRVMSYGTEVHANDVTNPNGGFTSGESSQFRYDIWDPTETLGTADSHMTLPNVTNTFLFCSAQILLPQSTSGELLILGGDTLKSDPWGVTNRGNSDVNLFTPSASGGTLVRNTQMILPRWYGSVTAMPNGEIYIQGGTGGEANPEIRRLNGTFELLSGIDTAEKKPDGYGYFDNNYPRNFIAPDGKIFGFDPNTIYRIDPAANGGLGKLTKYGFEWNYPATRTYSSGNFARGWSPTSATVMARPGKIFQFGGTVPDSTSTQNRVKAVDNVTLVDLIGVNDSPTWTPKITDLPPMNKARTWPSATVLPNGRVFVSGGSTRNILDDVATNYSDAGVIHSSTQIFDPAKLNADGTGQTGLWTEAAPMAVPRLYHSLTLLLRDGRILSTGGGAPGPYTNLNAQVYSPGYLFDAAGNPAVRPAVLNTSPSSLPLVVSPTPAGGSPRPTFQLQLATAHSSPIKHVTMIKTGAVTHSFDMEQRFVELDFTMSGNTLTVQMPANRFETPPGNYMVFVLDELGVPSMARMVRINPAS
jgi:hypothetical protein